MNLVFGGARCAVGEVSGGVVAGEGVPRKKLQRRRGTRARDGDGHRSGQGLFGETGTGDGGGDGDGGVRRGHGRELDLGKGLVDGDGGVRQGRDTWPLYTHTQPSPPHAANGKERV